MNRVYHRRTRLWLEAASCCRDGGYSRSRNLVPEELGQAGTCFRSGFNVELEAPSGFEPENGGFADLCLTTWLRRPVGKDHQTARLWKGESGAGNGIRTRDFDLGKVALYH